MSKQEDYVAESFINNLFGNLTVLQFNDNPNELWFIGKEVCDILGYTNSRKALIDHVYDEDKKVVTIRYTLGGSQNTTIINEAGLYQLIFSSKLPSARQFQHWVTHEVLPTMRSIGFTNSMSILRQELDILHNRLDNTECDKQYYKRQMIQDNSRYNRLEKDYNTLEDRYNELDSNYNDLYNKLAYVIYNSDNFWD